MSWFGRTRFNCIDVIFSLTGVNSNPGEEILDILCEKPDVTVHRLMHLLECAELTSVLDIIRQTLGNILIYIVINKKMKIQLVLPLLMFTPRTDNCFAKML